MAFYIIRIIGDEIRLFNDETETFSIIDREHLIDDLENEKYRVENAISDDKWLVSTMGKIDNFNYPKFKNMTNNFIVLGKCNGRYKVVDSNGLIEFYTPKQLHELKSLGPIINAKVEKEADKIIVKGIGWDIYDIREGKYTPSKNYKKEFDSFEGIVHELPTACGHKCYLASYGHDYLLYIPENVTHVNTREIHPENPENNLSYNLKKILDAANEEFESNAAVSYLRVIGGGKNLKSISMMLSNIDTLVSVDMSNFDTSEVTDMSFLLGGCNNVKHINFKNIDTRKVRDMSFMLDTFLPIKDLDLSPISTESVQNMFCMISPVEPREELDISHFKIKPDAYINNFINYYKDVQRIKVKDPRLIQFLQKDGYEGEIIS